MNGKIAILIGLFLVGLVLPAQAEYNEFTYFSYTGYLYPEKCLYALDGGSHFPNEFRPLLNDIALHHPQYSKGEIMNLIVAAHQRLRQDKPQVTVFEVTQDVRRFAEDDIGVDLSTCVAAYINSQTK